jgi:hypothetical protein
VPFNIKRYAPSRWSETKLAMPSGGEVETSLHLTHGIDPDQRLDRGQVGDPGQHPSSVFQRGPVGQVHPQGRGKVDTTTGR